MKLLHFKLFTELRFPNISWEEGCDQEKQFAKNWHNSQIYFLNICLLKKPWAKIYSAVPLTPELSSIRSEITLDALVFRKLI